MKDKKLLALVERASRKDQAAFEKLCEMKAREIIFLCTREMGNTHDGQDAAQEVFIRIHRNIGALKAPEAFNVWLNRIVVTTCSNLRRDTMKHKNLLALENYEDVFVDDTPVGLPHEFAEDADKRRRVMELIDELPDKYRTTVMLHYYQQLSYDDVAAVMDVSRNTVDHNLKMARKLLKVQLEDEFGAGEEEKKGKLPVVSMGALMAVALSETARTTISTGMIATCLKAAGVYTALAGAAGVAAGTGATGFFSGLTSNVAVQVAAAAVAMAAVGGGVWYAVDQAVTAQPSSGIYQPADPARRGMVEGTVVLSNDAALDLDAYNGLDGLSLELVNAEAPGQVVQTAVTAGAKEGGRYTFSGIGPGRYYVRALLPASARVVLPDETAEDGVQWLADGTTAPFEMGEEGAVACGQLTLDLPTPVSGTLRMTSGAAPPEGAFEGLRMELYDPQGRLVAVTETRADGSYLFSDAMVSQKGNYTLKLLERDGMQVTFTETTVEVYLEPRLN